MAQFMLLLHDHFGEANPPSEAEMMKIIQEYGAWSARLRAQGRLHGGQKLTDDPGRIARAGAPKPIVTDGPFAEAKEIVGGFFIIEAADYDEACGLIADCPHLKHGARIEIRQVHVF